MKMPDPSEPILLPEQDYQQLNRLAQQSQARGIKLNTRLIYTYWKTFFGVNKVPNGCPSCMRTDLTNFASRWRQYEAAGMIEIVPNVGNNL